MYAKPFLHGEYLINIHSAWPLKACTKDMLFSSQLRETKPRSPPRNALFGALLNHHPFSATHLPINNLQRPSPGTVHLEEPPQTHIADHKPFLPPIRPSDLRLLIRGTTLRLPKSGSLLWGLKKPLFFKKTTTEARRHVV